MPDQTIPPVFDAAPDASVNLRIDLPLSLHELTAALYDVEFVTLEDLEDDEWTRRLVMSEVGGQGLVVVRDRAERLRAEIDADAVDEPEWLAVCQRRVRDVFGRPATRRPRSATETVSAPAVLAVV